MITFFAINILSGITYALYKPKKIIDLDEKFNLYINSYNSISEIRVKNDISYARNFLFNTSEKEIIEIDNKQCFKLLNSKEITITHKEVQQKTILYKEQDPQLIFEMFFNFTPE